MKKLWLYGAILAVLTAACIFASCYLDRVNSDAADAVERAAEFARLGDLAAASEIFDSAHESWRDSSELMHAFVRHDVLDNSRTSFARACEMVRSGKKDEFLSECAALCELLRSLAQSDSASYLNIL